jgi:hypothetical protein
MKNNSKITFLSNNLISSSNLNLKKGYNYFSDSALSFNGGVKKGFLARLRANYFNLSTKLSRNYLDYFGINTGSIYQPFTPLKVNQSWQLNAKFILKGEYLNHSISKSYSLFNSFRITANVTNEIASTIVTIQNLSSPLLQSITFHYH